MSLRSVFDDLLLREVKIVSAINGSATNYEIEVNSKRDPKLVLKEKKNLAISLLKLKSPPFKARMVLIIKFKKEIEPIEYSIIPIISDQELVLESTDIRALYKRWSDELLAEIEEKELSGSGWKFFEFIKIRIEISKAGIVSGSSYVELPDFIKKKKAVVNLKNSDEECFKWCVTRAIFNKKTHPERIDEKLIEDSKKFNWDGVKFPTDYESIKIFEKNNNYSINVIVYDGGRFKTGLISKKKDNPIDLLLITKGIKSHYCWIKNLSRLLSSQIDANRHKHWFCRRCLNGFYKEDSFKNHESYCLENEPCKITMPRPGEFVKFKDFCKSMRIPFIIYADFECYTRKIHTCDTDPNYSYTNKIQLHEPSGFCYYLKTIDDFYKPKLVCYTGKNAGKHFVKSIEKTVLDLYSKIKIKEVELSEENEVNYNNSTICHICGGELKGDKVLDHCHITGKYRGAAHNSCNLNYPIPNHIPVVFHNLAGYDCHLFIKSLGLSDGKITAIANNEEKYISFSKTIKVGEKDGKGVRKEIIFIDSFKFMASSLQNLVGNLKKEDFKNLKMKFKDIDLLLRKGVFPYDYFDSEEKLEETKLPPKKRIL